MYLITYEVDHSKVKPYTDLPDKIDPTDIDQVARFVVTLHQEKGPEENWEKWYLNQCKKYKTVLIQVIKAGNVNCLHTMCNRGSEILLLGTIEFGTLEVFLYALQRILKDWFQIETLDELVALDLLKLAAKNPNKDVFDVLSRLQIVTDSGGVIPHYSSKCLDRLGPNFVDLMRRGKECHRILSEYGIEW